jgi:hypothetical protein
MTAIDNTPVNRNFLSPLNYKFTIKKAPNVNFYCQSINVPSITLNSPIVNNPFVKVPYPGEHIDYEELKIEFIVDEDLNNYREITGWMTGLGKPESFSQYANLDKNPSYTGLGIYSDVSVMVLNSAKEPNYELVFTDAFPVYISGFKLQSMADDVTYVTVEASFKYTLFKVARVI